LDTGTPSNKFLSWKVFFILVLANAVISFYPSPLWVKAVIGLIFILGPLTYLGFSTNLPASQTLNILNMDFFPSPSWVALGAVTALAVILRLAGLTSLSGWPNFDEGWVSFLSLKLSQKWDWSLLLSSQNQPPFYFWGEALFFRLFGPSLSSLWLYPALLSLAALPVGYWAAQRYFSKNFSFFCLLFGVVNYWLVWGGRLSEPLNTVFPFECLALGILGVLLGAREKGKLGAWPLLLGIAAGLCAYTATLSFFGVALITLTVSWMGWKDTALRKPLWVGFGIGLLIVLPLIGCAFGMGYGHYIASLWVSKDSGYYENHWMAPLSHITAVFWGARDWTLWGGLLNPVESALVFLGLAFAAKTHQAPLQSWLLSAFVFFFLPGMFTNNFEPFRAFLLVPVLLVLMVMGLGWLMSECTTRFIRGAAAVALLALCGGLNLYHLWGPYHQTWGQLGPGSSRFKSIETWRAYDVLNEIQQKEGPGLIFSDFGLNTYYLIIPAYPFNALDNPQLGKPKWAALVTNAQFAPYLSGVMPDCKWVWLSEHISSAQGGLELGIFPLTEQNTAIVERWKGAQVVLREALWETFDSSHPDPQGRALRLLQTNYSNFQGDPFLETLYWDHIQSTQLELGNTAGAVEALQKGLQLGYRNDYFYLWLGELLKQEGQGVESQRAFAEAKACVKGNGTK
jgi:4-amino-4-deoxy-L-arabinose transferase-like glycosyltransferase